MEDFTIGKKKKKKLSRLQRERSRFLGQSGSQLYTPTQWKTNHLTGPFLLINGSPTISDAWKKKLNLEISINSASSEFWLGWSYDKRW